MQGTILGSRYRVIEYIAKGGFGKTYLAEDNQLPGKDKCVVKQLYPSIEDPGFVKVARRLFKTEAETLNTLGSHDQIPQLLAYFEEGEKFYLVQQYVEGHTLSKELPDGKPWSEAKVIELLKDCLNILGFIHSKNVIHRDVKPDNLIRRKSDNKLVLVDFGTVKEVVAEQTQLVPGTVAVGTRGYMPTEQARGKPRTTSDIYALGVIGIQALTGVSPLSLVEDDEGEIVWESLADTSPQLTKILTKMTRYHFKNRQQSATEVLEDLNSLSNPPIKAAAPPGTEKVEYTPTVQLSPSQLANMPQADNVVASQDTKSQTIVTANDNLDTKSQSPHPDSQIPNLSEIKENLNPSNEQQSSNSMTNTSNSRNFKALAALGVALLLGGGATAGMHFFKLQTAKNIEATLAESETEFKELIENKDFETCHENILKMEVEADPKAESAKDEKVAVMPEDMQKDFKAQCGLELAKSKANNRMFVEALAIAITLPEGTKIEENILEHREAWSKKVLQQASDIYNKEGKLKEALQLVEQIPQDSSIRQQIIDTKDNWNAEFDENEANIASAQEALSNEKWRFAKQQATKVKDSTSPFWQEKAKAIISQADDALGLTETSGNNKSIIQGENEGIEAEQPEVETPTENVEVRQPEIKTPPENVEVRQPEVETPTENVEVRQPEIKTPPEVTPPAKVVKPAPIAKPVVPPPNVQEYEQLRSKEIPDYDQGTQTINQPINQPPTNPPNSNIPDYVEPGADDNLQPF